MTCMHTHQYTFSLNHPLLTFPRAHTRAGVILLAPESRLADWDLIICDSFGPDISFINAALQAVFARYSVQSSSIGMQGFSDGATYALTLGVCGPGSEGGVFGA